MKEEPEPITTGMQTRNMTEGESVPFTKKELKLPLFYEHTFQAEVHRNPEERINIEEQINPEEIIKRTNLRKLRNKRKEEEKRNEIANQSEPIEEEILTNTLEQQIAIPPK
ncbi:hypothetical protein PUN28_016959 [Cardiocondyla obscurior]|uniref:Uncharacterized protein n=1 Tax=Cardiocondyla obscurior TaxID=286306 RepID=A0AAW2EJP7_9HYME